MGANRLLVAAAMLWLVLVGARSGWAAGPRFGYDTHADFVAFDPKFPERHDQFSRELDQLHADMIRQQKAGRKTPCLRQIFLEARWLVYHTADYARCRNVLDHMKEVLAMKQDPHGRGQVEADGSFAPCCDAWWLKLDMSCDELITMSYKWQEPKYPLKLLEKVNSPEKLTAYIDSLLISDIRKTGVNNALELNMAVASDLQRFILYEGTLKELPTKVDLDPKLRETILHYQDDKWQDPQTGMWGAWYRAADGSIVKTANLSITFHLVSFRGGAGVGRWPQLIDTTLAFKNDRYPFGWLEDGQYLSNHHNMDIVRLWRLGWKEATPLQRQQMSKEIDGMLDFCLHKSLQPDGSFNSPEEDTVSSAFYFGVSFLNEIGYFSKKNRFWTDRTFPQATEVRERIEKRMKAIGLDDSEAQWATWILKFDRD